MLNHLLELRRRTLHTLVFFGSLFAFFFFYTDELFKLLVSPLLHSLHAEDHLIATQVTSPVFTPLKLAADAAFLLTTPFALLQLWRFISPGLYTREKNHLRSVVLLSILLFLIGVLFCFFFVLPFMFQFFTQAMPKAVRFMPDMADAIDFITRMLILFGLSFQVPLICLVLVRLRLVTVQTLRQLRPYWIVAAFTIGMLLTPPDVFSQVMLALPLCFLYELGLLLARFQWDLKIGLKSSSRYT
ncbi:MAG: twin-arginine translocase subunit TatC [Legionella sp.]|nr:MAG: twin-arginine translocase subunit TatC [Legionella sp.]